MIHRGNTFILHPTAEQSERMGQFSGVCRLVWNLCIEQRRDWYRNYKNVTGSTLNWVTQSREIKHLREEFDFIKDCPRESLDKVIINLESAFSDFFRGGKGFPKMKKKGVNECFSVSGRWISFTKINEKWAMVKLPKLGWVKFRQTRPIEGKISDVTISKTSLGWQVSFNCKIDRDIADVGGSIGIDRGVAVPVALSDGQSFATPISLDNVDRQQRKAQRISSRRKLGSNRHKKAQQRVRNLAARKARIRKDWAHKVTTAVAAQYGTVVIERLRTKNMTASGPGKRGLNRSILNVGWFQIEQMLAYKAFKLIKINPAYTSQCCSSCGVIDKRSRKSQADFQCVECGFEANADHNAAINILNRGNTAVLDVEGSGCRPCEASTADKATVA